MYSQQNNELHKHCRFLKPQLQAAYDRWEKAKYIEDSGLAYQDWNYLMNEELATAMQIKEPTP